MSEQRWTEETVELVARVDYEHNGGIGDYAWDKVGEAMREEWRGDARAVLAALADAGLLVTPSTPDSPRTWTLPAAPGPEVTAVRTECPTCPGPVGGSLWHRLADDTWRCRDEGVHHDWVHGWVGLMVEHGDATDATGEVHSGMSDW